MKREENPEQGHGLGFEDPFRAALRQGLDLSPHLKFVGNQKATEEDLKVLENLPLTIHDVLQLKKTVSHSKPLYAAKDSHQMALAASPINPANLTLNFTIITNYLSGNMTVNCQRHCYQRYINQGNILFQGQCRSEVYSATNLANYKFLNLLSLHQELRNQICGKT